ncbi:PREDICTED: probable receptor-like protein kinase At1g67000 isoform X2 [Brassica oleracea var. oleracea]|uniref:probable receptor-like protein kinase At1g67000 isoform X2 n=1 Tax=Brassica oleracea var. oleracea TaxID=109376 RepID=UPI0006A749D6|nr:PREDICTED: probable receptor-like protein kinase At1g67000 isoform X2 [Brassica oleracea var. oleracea]
MGSFCSSNFTNTTLPPNLFKLSSTYKSVTVLYNCNPFGLHLSGYKCPEIGSIFVSDKPGTYNFCPGGFTANVPRSFVTKRKDLADLESILKKGFEVKVKMDKSEYEHGKNGPLHPPTVDELHQRCSGPFSCGNKEELLFYPFWRSGRENCGHPDFKLDCSGEFPELDMSSVKYRILSMSYEDSPVIRLARSDYIGNLCPPDPRNASLSESILQLVRDTDLLTLYYDCNYLLPPGSVGSYIRVLGCGYERGGRTSYYVTRNLSSYLLKGISDLLYNFTTLCSRNVSIPVSRQALDELEESISQDNLEKALDRGFELGVNNDCSQCIESRGACGYSQNSRSFICYCVDKPHSRTCRDTGLSTAAKAGTGSACGLVGVILTAVVLFCLFIRRRKTSDVPRQLNLKDLIPLEHYSYAQVKRITKSFSEVVGKGGFGIVYRGTICDGRKVAVKVLNDTTGNGEDFVNEVVSMSKTSHVNIVTLLGFCAEGTKRAILYEFLENGSLDKFISSKRSSNMDWMELYGIALGVARGLEYLHHGCRTRIVHFDIKPQNVLLDGNLCPKVSDFGLAKLCERKESILSLLDTRGTIGYIAPEVFSRVYGRVSHKSDVYSYGMLVLEMIGARTKTSSEDTASSTSSVYFPEWIYKDLEKGNSGTPTGNGISNEEEEIAKKMALVGLWCVQYSPSDRPSMNRVVEMMEGSIDALEVPPRPVLQIPTAPLPESSTVSEDISVYTEVCSMNIA